MAKILRPSPLPRGLVIVALLSLMLGMGLSVTRADQAPNWPTSWTKFRFAPDNNAVWNAPNATAAKWKTHVGATLITDASIANGVLYMGSEESKVLAFDAASGKQLWVTEVDNRIRGQMLVADGKVFLGTGNRDFKRDYIDEQDNPILIRGRGQSSVYALDAATGSVIWRYDTVGEDMPTGMYKDGVYYFANGDRHFYALDANTGTLLWKLYVGSYDSVSSLNTNGSLLYAGGADPNAFYAFDPAKQQIAWSVDTHVAEVGGIDDCSAAYADGLLFTDSVTRLNADGTYGGHGIYAINANTGEFMWTFDEGDGAMIENNKCGVPVAYKGAVYAGSPVTRAMYALDQKTGKLLWKIPNTGVIKAPPVLYNDKIYFTNVDGLLFVADAISGNITKVVVLGGKLNTQGPMIANGSLYIGNQKGDMQAIPLSDLQ